MLSSKAENSQILASITSLNTMIEKLSDENPPPLGAPANLHVGTDEVRSSDRNLSNRSTWCGARAGGSTKCRRRCVPQRHFCSAAPVESATDDIMVDLEANHNDLHDEPQDFSFLKRDLSADQEGRNSNDETACVGDLLTIEKILQNMHEHVQQLAGQVNDAEVTDRMKDEVLRLKRHLKDLGVMVTSMQRGSDRPYAVRMQGKLGQILRNCPHSGRNLNQSRDRLADLKNLYERSLLITPSDIHWPFIHLVSSNKPPLSEDPRPFCC